MWSWTLYSRFCVGAVSGIIVCGAVVVVDEMGDYLATNEAN